jgi:hypothetical protein
MAYTQPTGLSSCHKVGWKSGGFIDWTPVRSPAHKGTTMGVTALVAGVGRKIQSAAAGNRATR